MPVVTDVSKRVVLRYEDESLYSFSRLTANATATQMYNLAETLNGLQSVEATRISAVETTLIV